MIPPWLGTCSASPHDRRPGPARRRPLRPRHREPPLSALRGVLKECWRLGYVSSEAYQRAADLEPIRGARLPKGRALQAGEVRALFADCAVAEARVRAARDAALLAVLYGCGLRRAEAVGLDLADYVEPDGALKVRGKGNKERLAYVGDQIGAALAGWLAVRGRSEGPLFLPPLFKGGRLAWRRMTEQAVLVIARRRAKEAGVAVFSPHDLSLGAGTEGVVGDHSGDGHGSARDRLAGAWGRGQRAGRM